MNITFTTDLELITEGTIKQKFNSFVFGFYGTHGIGFKFFKKSNSILSIRTLSFRKNFGDGIYYTHNSLHQIKD